MILSNHSIKFVEYSGKKPYQQILSNKKSAVPSNGTSVAYITSKNADFEVIAAIAAHKNAKIKFSDVDNLHIIRYNICR